MGHENFSQRERKFQKPWVAGGQSLGWGNCQGFVEQCHTVGREQQGLGRDTAVLK